MRYSESGGGIQKLARHARVYAGKTEPSPKATEPGCPLKLQSVRLRLND